VHRDDGPRRCLDERSRALVGLGALLATGAAATAYRRRVTDALDAGVTADEIVDTLVEVAPIVGLAQLVPATIELATALDYDIDRALESVDDPP
jgi:alkylhydroperoxidase/carboxymuconolactone decarboxylase family protein YurZ